MLLACCSARPGTFAFRSQLRKPAVSSLWRLPVDACQSRYFANSVWQDSPRSLAMASCSSDGALSVARLDNERSELSISSLLFSSLCVTVTLLSGVTSSLPCFFLKVACLSAF